MILKAKNLASALNVNWSTTIIWNLILIEKHDFDRTNTLTSSLLQGASDSTGHKTVSNIFIGSGDQNIYSFQSWKKYCCPFMKINLFFDTRVKTKVNRASLMTFATAVQRVKICWINNKKWIEMIKTPLTSIQDMLCCCIESIFDRIFSYNWNHKRQSWSLFQIWRYKIIKWG